ncbi:hypothetical protein [Mycobacterium sp. E342]|nr:hypothetical protein [Mycobacterium sp. E342]
MVCGSDGVPTGAINATVDVTARQPSPDAQRPPTSSLGRHSHRPA